MLVAVTVFALAGVGLGLEKPENSHSCNGNTLCSFSSLLLLSRFLFVGTSLILISSIVRLLISLFDISLNDLFRLSNLLISTILVLLVETNAHDPVKLFTEIERERGKKEGQMVKRFH